MASFGPYLASQYFSVYLLAVVYGLKKPPDRTSVDREHS